MKKSTAISLVASMALTGSQALGAVAISDATIRHEMIGSWIVPLDSSDFDSRMSRTLELYQSDGIVTLVIFRDPDCKNVDIKLQGRWEIKDHILISHLPDGSLSHDEVVSIGDGKVILHSLEDGTTYTRVHSDTCAMSQR